MGGSGMDKIRKILFLFVAFQSGPALADQASALAAFNMMEAFLVLVFKASMLVVFLFMARNISRIRRAVEKKNE